TDSTHPNRVDTLTDGDIAVLVVTANTLDSAAGAYAQTRTSNTDVRAFAARMVREHGAANRQAAPLARRLGPPMSTPHENTDVRTLRSRADDAKAELARDSGAAFDRKYIEHEVKDHEDLLQKLDR